MSYRRDQRTSRSALFDDIEGGGLRTSYSRDIGDIDERDNDKAIDTLHDRVNFLKRLTGDVHEEVESHNRMLDRMGNDMDASRGILSGTVERFKMVFEKKSNRRMCKLVACFVVSFLILCYTIRQNGFWLEDSFQFHTFMYQKFLFWEQIKYDWQKTIASLGFCVPLLSGLFPVGLLLLWQK